jgi:hypothetical protein
MSVAAQDNLEEYYRVLKEVNAEPEIYRFFDENIILDEYFISYNFGPTISKYISKKSIIFDAPEKIGEKVDADLLFVSKKYNL